LALTLGTRLGPYEILAAIGAGGMGEVYRATDTNLKRSVAIKVLPASVAGDADRLARFQREAEVLAALNHPNIAAIYGLEKTADLTALVMELVEGEDLSSHIARGPIPLAEALLRLISARPSWRSIWRLSQPRAYSAAPSTSAPTDASSCRSARRARTHHPGSRCSSTGRHTSARIGNAGS